MSIRLIITQGNEVVADIPEWDGPVPREGDYIHHPAGTEPVPGLSDGFMLVKSDPIWGIMARPGLPLAGEEEVSHFVGAAEPFVEISV